MPRTQTDRSRQNEELFARANERIKDTAQSLSVEPAPFLCECSAVSCTEVVRVTLDTYRRVRERDAFLLTPGHDDPHVETVVEDCGSYVLVEKFRQDSAS